MVEVIIPCSWYRLSAKKYGHFKTLDVFVSNTLGTLLHACPHYIGRGKNICLLKKISFDYKCVFKDLIVVIYVDNLK